MIIIKRCTLRLNMELFERIRLLAKVYNLNVNAMMIFLMEIGYLKMIGDDKIEEKNIYRRRS